MKHLRDVVPEPPTSAVRFPDGGGWRIEIPSVEGPAALRAVLEEASRLQVPLHRVSQGSGVMMLTDDEITEMVGLADAVDVEVCLFLGPRGTWDIGGAVTSPTGGAGPRVRGLDQVRHNITEATRAAHLGVRNLLVADEGVLWTLHELRRNGTLPEDMRFKISVLTGPVNPASFQVMGALGGDSINVPSDLTVTHVAEIRAHSSAALDMYLEAPDDVGGFVRLYDAAELIRVGAPIYLKLGLRNAPGIYPVGEHLRDTAVQTARERVRRARLTLDILERAGGAPIAMSPVGDHRLPVPDRFAAPEVASHAG